MSDPIENFNFVEGLNIDDSRFTSHEITAAQKTIRSYIEDRFKNLDVSPASGLHDTLIRPSSILYLVTRSIIENFSSSRSLHDALLGDGNEKIVDAILSNYFIQRKTGNTSRGVVRIDTENFAINQTIDSGQAFFTSSGLNFFPVRNYFASASRNRERDVTIFRSGKGSSGYFFVDVIAENTGSTYNIQKDTQLEYQGSIDGKISCTAFNNFSGGENNESNESLLNRLVSALSTRNMTSPAGIDRSIREFYPKTVYTSSHGVYSEFMTRASHNVFGVKSGCYCDVYVKTSASVVLKEISLIASRINNPGDPNHQKFLITIDQGVFPGHYDIIRVSPKTNDKTVSSFSILSKERFLSLRGSPQNFIFNEQEGAFSTYSSTNVIFDISTGDWAQLGVSPQNQIAVNCSIIGQDGIKEIQDYVNQGGNQSTLIDTLIKSCVPCFISIGPVSVRADKGSDVSPETIASEISSYISEVNPSKDQIRSDAIVSRVMSINGVRSVDLPIRINATIICPNKNAERINLTTVSNLEVPTIKSKFVGRDTIGFFVEPGSININILKG
jgi:hypothetical protein